MVLATPLRKPADGLVDHHAYGYAVDHDVDDPAAVMRRPETPGAPTVDSMTVTSTAAAWVPIEPMSISTTGATGRPRKVSKPRRGATRSLCL